MSVPGGPRATPPGTPPLPSRPSRSRQASAATPAPKFADTRAEGRGRCASAPAHSALPGRSPASRRQPRPVGASGRPKGTSTNESSPRAGGPGPQRGRGRTGRSPCGDVGSLSRCVSLATAFPSQVSGGPPPPIQLFPQWGVVRGGGGGRKQLADPAPLRFRQPLLSPASVYLSVPAMRTGPPPRGRGGRPERERAAESFVVR